MADVTNPYLKTLPPHIHSEETLSKRYWGQIGALIPVLIAACFLGKIGLLKILLVSVVSAVAFESLAAKLFQKKERLRSGEAVLIAVLLALLMPPGCPAEVVIFGVFLAVFVAREMFGGTGSYLFHPVLLARVFLQASFPKLMTAPLILSEGGSFWIFGAWIISAVLFLKQKQGYWETPILYAGIYSLCGALFGVGESLFVFFNGVLLTAFFLLADPVTMPLTREGTRVFVLGAALLSGLLAPHGFSISAAGISILLMNLLTPWIDLWLRPSFRPTNTRCFVSAARSLTTGVDKG